MKSRLKLFAFASIVMASAIVACQSDSTSSPGGSAGSANAGSGGASAGTGGKTTGGAGGGTGGTGGSAAGTGGSTGGDPCMGEEKTIVDLNQVKAPLPENRIRLKGVVATSKKFLVSPSKSGCLWGIYVTAPGAAVVNYGSILLVSKGAAPVTDDQGKSVCLTDDASTGSIPKDLVPGDTLDVSGFLDEFLQGACGKASSQDPNVINPKPDVGQRQFKDVACVTKTGSGAVPAPLPIADTATLDAIAQGKNTDDLLYKLSGALVTVTAPLTTKQLPTEKYFNCSAVSGFGDLNFNETSLNISNTLYYNDVSCAGPRDGNKRYDFEQPTTFSAITGIVSVNFCTWELTVRSRCGDTTPESPSCAVAADECAKADGATKCSGTEDTAALCSDGIDNNGNSFADCEDKGCCALVDCKTTAPTSYCGKGGGAGGSTGSEDTAALCGDGVDNDGDNFIDCEDKNCCAVVDCKTTAPASYCGKGGGTGGSGGSGGGSGSEDTAALCGDGKDNDGDNFIDCDDKNCCAVVDCKTTAPTSYCGKNGGAGGSSGSEDTAALCSDKKDNDGDNFIDCEDKNCCAVVDCKTTAPSSYCATH